MTRNLIPGYKACNRFVLLLLAMIFTTICAHAQDKEFWFVVPDVAYNSASEVLDRPIFFVISTGSQAAQVTMNQPANSAAFGAPRVYNIAAYSSQVLTYINAADITLLENSVVDATTGVKNNKGLLFTSTAPISIYYQVDAINSKDIFSLKGTKALGTEFYTPFQTRFLTGAYVNAFPQFHIVATEDNTQVSIKPTANIVGTNANATKTVTLDRGETFAARAVSPSLRLGGSYISSTKPISVVVADDLINTGGGADLVADQLVPTANLGTNHVVIRGFTTGTYGDYIYVVGTRPNTQLYLNGSGTSSKTIQAGETYEIYMNESTPTLYIKSDNPVYVFQLSGARGEMGAALLPSMYSINSRRISFFVNAGFTDYLFLLVKSGNEGDFRLNGQAGKILASSFGNVPGLTGWKYARIDVNSVVTKNAVNTVDNTKSPFALGYFRDASGSALYGYLSTFGQLEFADTTFVCPGQSTTIDAGYAKSYKWWRGESSSEPATGISTSNTYTVPVGQTGYYTVKVDQDPFLVTATTYVEVDTFRVRANIPTFIKVNSPQSLQANVKRNIGKAYAWTFDAGTTPATSAAQNPTGVSWSTVGSHNVTLKVTNADLYCDTTLTQLVTVYDIQDDYASTMSDVSITANVLANDNFPGCTPVVSIATAPLHGTATVVGNAVRYTPNANFVGIDILTYKASCGANDATAQLKIYVAEKPDNISSKECFGTPEPNNFDMQEKFKVAGIHSMSTPMVADLDVSDDHVDILAPLEWTTAADPWYAKNLRVINGKTGAVVRDIVTAKFSTHGQAITTGDVDKDGKCEIFVMSSDDKKIYCYNGATGAAKAGFTTTIALNNKYLLCLADINNDGTPELVAGPYIFNAKTGALLVNGTAQWQTYGTGYGNPHNMSADQAYYMYALADFNGDGDLEMAAGNTLYDINIGSGTLSVIRTANTSALGMTAGAIDGQTIAVDFDGDGKLDVAVLGRTKGTVAPGTTFENYVWNPLTGEVIARKRYTGMDAQTIPYVGDLDGNGTPEIVFATGNAANKSMIALTYDASVSNTTTLKMREMHNYPLFGETAGFTVFDFDQDGKVEIVYRGIKQLYIVNGQTLAPLSTPIQSFSGTVAEYPLVADVDGDGHAEIIVTRSYTDWFVSSASLTGWLSVYRSDTPGTWAPGRSVWNQWAYNVVNINEDMTVPQYPINPVTQMPNGKRPYNAFLQQASLLNTNGDLLYLTPNAIFDSDPIYTWNGATNTLEAKVTIKNIGDADLIAPVHVSVYKDAVVSANLLGTGSGTSSISPGATGVVVVNIPNISSKLPISSLHVRLNDNGTKYPVQQQCKYDGTTNETPFADMLIAQNDTTNVRYSVPVTVPILDNDSYPCGASVAVTVLTAPTKGSFVLNADKTITYTLTTSGFSSTDFLDYQISCGANLSSARVFFMVSKLVAVDTIIGTAKEGDPTKGKLRFYLLDNVTHTKKLRITFSLSGTAVVATDYSMPSTSILPIYSADIPIGQNGTEVEVTAINNFRVEGPRKAMVKIEKVEEIP